MISIIVTCFNESEIINEFIITLNKEISKINEKFELIFVDNKSSDNTLEIIKNGSFTFEFWVSSESISTYDSPALFMIGNENNGIELGFGGIAVRRDPSQLKITYSLFGNKVYPIIKGSRYPQIKIFKLISSIFKIAKLIE